jgi:hypothetical protein
MIEEQQVSGAWIDLRKDILEDFEEMSQYVQARRLRMLDPARGLFQLPIPYRLSEPVHTVLRWTPTPLPVLQDRCSECGATVEHRVGNPRPLHFGRCVSYGRDRKNEASGKAIPEARKSHS